MWRCSNRQTFPSDSDHSQREVGAYHTHITVYRKYDRISPLGEIPQVVFEHCLHHSIIKHSLLDHLRTRGKPSSVYRRLTQPINTLSFLYFSVIGDSTCFKVWPVKMVEHPARNNNKHQSVLSNQCSGGTLNQVSQYQNKSSLSSFLTRGLRWPDLLCGSDCQVTFRKPSQSICHAEASLSQRYIFYSFTMEKHIHWDSECSSMAQRSRLK